MSETPEQPAPQDMTYEQATAELEQLIDKIERGELGLEASLAARKRGDALIRRCRGILDTAEQELKQIVPDPDADGSGV